eukprot:RCo037406
MTDPAPITMACPICQAVLPLATIEAHAALCLEARQGNGVSPPGREMCPVCMEFFPVEEVGAHVEACLAASTDRPSSSVRPSAQAAEQRPALQCPLCAFSCRAEDQLERHMQSSHPEPERGEVLGSSECPICFDDRPGTEVTSVCCRQRLCSGCAVKQHSCPFCRAFPWKYHDHSGTQRMAGGDERGSEERTSGKR